MNLIIRCLSESLSPMTHMSGTAGNEAIIAREAVTTPRGVVWLPCISGNAFRHRAIREPGMRWLIEEYDLEGNLTLEQLNFLLHGGNLTQSNAHENTKRIAEMKRVWPLMRLIGGCLPNQILAGSLDVWRGVLVCEENRAVLKSPPDSSLYSAEVFIGEYQYTRGDAGKYGLESDELVAADSKTNLMIYAGQTVQRGARWEHGFVLKHVSEIEIGALLWSLRLWQSTGGTVGGQASKGHGRLSCELVDFGLDQEALCDAYVAYVYDVKNDAIEWLREVWG